MRSPRSAISLLCCSLALVLFTGGCRAGTPESSERPLPTQSGVPATPTASAETSPTPPPTPTPTATPDPTLEDPQAMAELRMRWHHLRGLDEVLREHLAFMDLIIDPTGSMVDSEIVLERGRRDLGDIEWIQMALDDLEQEMVGFAEMRQAVIDSEIAIRIDLIGGLNQEREGLLRDDPQLATLNQAIAILEDELGTLRQGELAEFIEDPEFLTEIEQLDDSRPWSRRIAEHLVRLREPDTRAERVVASRAIDDDMPLDADLAAAVAQLEQRFAPLEAGYADHVTTAVGLATGDAFVDSGLALDAAHNLRDQAALDGLDEWVAAPAEDLRAQLRALDEPTLENAAAREAFGRYARAVVDQVVRPVIDD